jgi:hypothetical protein
MAIAVSVVRSLRDQRAATAKRAMPLLCRRRGRPCRRNRRDQRIMRRHASESTSPRVPTIWSNSL